MDAVTVFLNSELRDEIYMTQPEGFYYNSGRVCKLQKSLGGLKKSSRLWNDHFNKVLLSIGLTRSEVDLCVYYHISGNDKVCFSANHGKAHWTAIKRVMRYLKGTMDYGLGFSKEESDIRRFCNSDWGSDERRSITGYIFQCQGSPISLCTRRQRAVALSSTEAELMYLTAEIQKETWLQRLQHELTPNASKTIVLSSDNKSAIHAALNNSYSARTKHVDIKSKFIRQNLESRMITLP